MVYELVIAKTLCWQTDPLVCSVLGLMDTGVGCAIFATALAERGAKARAPDKKHASLTAALAPAAPLLALGTSPQQQAVSFCLHKYINRFQSYPHKGLLCTQAWGGSRPSQRSATG